MGKSGGISGLGVALATAGGFLMFTGIKDVPILEGLRQITRGQPPAPGAPKPSRTAGLLDGLHGYASANAAEHALDPGPAAGSGAHPEIATQALQFVGKPYVFGAAGPGAFDCSGLVKYVFEKLGYASLPHSAAAQIMSPKFVKIPRSQVGAGDLVYWPGHIGIALDNRRGVFAPRPGKSVEVTPIDSSGPIKGAPTLCARWKG